VFEARCEDLMLYWRVKGGGFVKLMVISGCLFNVKVLTRDSSRGAEENGLTTAVERSACRHRDVLITC